jgi:DNA-binding MarR family transcriptional regulator
MVQSKNRASRARKSLPAAAPQRDLGKQPATIERLQPDDAVLREFIADFSAASSLMRKLRRSLAASLQLSASEYSILIGLWYCQQRGETNIRELADHLHVAAAHVTVELRSLASRNLIRKVPSSSDRRAFSVELTKPGLELLNQLAPLLAEVNVVLFAGVSFSEMVVVHRFLKRVVEQASEATHIAEKRARQRLRPQRGR